MATALAVIGKGRMGESPIGMIGATIGATGTAVTAAAAAAAGGEGMMAIATGKGMW